MVSVEYLLRYGEIGLKSSRVRRSMKERLIRNVGTQCKHRGTHCSFREEEGRLMLSSDYEEVPYILSRTFGLVSFSPVETCSSRMDDLAQLAVDTAGRMKHRGPRFAIRARRVGEHSYTSMDAARELGSAILEAYPELKVDLTEPDWEVILEIRGEKAYFASEVHPGPGGLPMGSQGRVVALVESSDGVLAAWLMMKRGCRVFPVYRREEKWVETLSRWDPDIEGRPIEDMKGIEDVVRVTGSIGVVYPGGLEEAEEEDSRPAFHPLVGFTESELENLRRTVLESASLG